jgi:hypothetical protein
MSNCELVKRIVLVGGALAVSVWVAFKGTPDLDRNEHRWTYRLAYSAFLWRGVMFLFESLNLISKVG